MSTQLGKNIRVQSLLSVAILFLAACSTASSGGEGLATATSLSSQEGTTESTPIVPQPDSRPITLKLWLPPAFDPTRGDLAATILQGRLDEFREANSNIQIEVRLKNESGEGNLLNSLQAAQDAAPLALPDLVLIASDLLPSAIEGQLLLPLDDRLSEPFDDDWYSFGLQAVQSDGQSYGLPLAGDALIMVHRFSALEQLPRNWDESLEAPLVIAFAAADPHAFFTLTQLLAGSEETAPFTEFSQLDPEQLQAVLAYYAEGRANGIFPFWLAQFESQDQSWQAFIEGQSAMVVTWSSRFLISSDSNLGAGLLPTRDGQGFTLARSWAWAVSNSDAERSRLALELAEFLSAPEFIAQWSAASGLIPSRSSALAAWSPDQRQALASQIVTIAKVLPGADFRIALGDPLSQAIVALLKEEITLDEAAQFVQDSPALP